MTHHAMTRTDALVAFLARMLIAWRRPLGALFLLLTLVILMLVVMVVIGLVISGPIASTVGDIPLVPEDRDPFARTL